MDDQNEIVETAEKALSKFSGGRVLDVATGVGGFITFLIENLKDYSEIIGIDSNEDRLNTARKSLILENIQFKCMDATHMDFPEEYFDTVSIANSLHHMADLPGVFSETMRVCKPGGKIIISETYRDHQSDTQLTNVYLHDWWAAVDTAEGISHHKTFTRQKIMELTGMIGLQHLAYVEEKDLESDPKDPELIKELDNIIDRFIQRSKAVQGGKELAQRGKQLRRRVHKVGFHGATSLFIFGEK
jgi:ubiquinone/menaquinone biosynthesis C-methylase UbiE